MKTHYAQYRAQQNDEAMKLDVDTKILAHGDVEPFAFRLGARELAVVQVTDRWLATDHSYFKVEANDGATYILRYVPHEEEWEMTWFQAAMPSPGIAGQ